MIYNSNGSRYHFCLEDMYFKSSSFVFRYDQNDNVEVDVLNAGVTNNFTFSVI